MNPNLMKYGHVDLNKQHFYTTSGGQNTGGLQMQGNVVNPLAQNNCKYLK